MLKYHSEAVIIYPYVLREKMFQNVYL